MLKKIKIILKNFIPEPPPSVDRPNFFLFQAWFHVKINTELNILKFFKIILF